MSLVSADLSETSVSVVPKTRLESLVRSLMAGGVLPCDPNVTRFKTVRFSEVAKQVHPAAAIFVLAIGPDPIEHQAGQTGGLTRTDLGT